MLGIYLLVTIFSQLSPQNVDFTAAHGPAQVQVQFADLNGIKIGAPVVYEGQTVGSVSKISDHRSNKTIRPFNVEVKIDPLHRASLRRGTIALIASHLTSEKGLMTPVVELVAPNTDISPDVAPLLAEILSDGATISGFSSYEEFWKSPEQV